MPAPIISEAWADALEPGIREWFYLGAGSRKNLKREQIFNVFNGTRAVEHFENFGAISTDAWEDYSKSGKVAVVGFDRGYKTNITPEEFIVELPIKRTYLEDNLYTQILQPAMQLGDSAANFMETKAASVFNNAASASFLGGDGVALASASHPNGPDVSGTQSNIGTAALTVDNIEAARLAMQAFKDDKGNLVGAMPDMIIVPPGLDFSALQINNSSMDPRTANNATNPRFGAYEIVRWDYLTDSNNWFLVDSTRMRMNLLWDNRVPLDIRLKNQDTTVFATWIARTRFGYGWTDWRWLYMQNVT